jgi:protein involved in polysaccharide export with SLBB domain
MHRCKKSLASRARFALLSMCLGCFVAPRVRAQAQPAAPPVQTPAPVQGSTPDQMAVPQTPENQVGKKPGDSHPSEQGGSTPDLRLGPGDLVEVSVYGVPELATKARVSNDGDLYLPLIDYVHVADLSLEEFQKLIEKRLDDGGFVRNPHVTIFVDDFSSQGVSLLGEVGKPGIYPVLGNRRLFDLVSAAGGLTGPHVHIAGWRVG